MNVCPHSGYVCLPKGGDSSYKHWDQAIVFHWGYFLNAALTTKNVVKNVSEVDYVLKDSLKFQYIQ